MATDPRILSSLVKSGMKDDKANETTLNIEEDLGVLGSDGSETDHERDLAVPPSQNKGEDDSARPGNAAARDGRPGSDGNG